MKTFLEILPSLAIAISGALFGCAVTLFVQRVKVRQMVRAARESDAVWFPDEACACDLCREIFEMPTDAAWIN